MQSRHWTCAAPLLAALLAGCQVNVSRQISSGNSRSGRSVTATRKASAGLQGARTVRAATDFGEISVEPGGPAVEIEAKVTVSGPYEESVLKSWAGKISPAARKDGGALVVDTPRPAGMPADMGFTSSYRLKVPREVALDLRSANGSIRARGVDGGVRAVSSFGAVTVEAVRGSVDARSDNGAVDVKEITGEVQARSSFGWVRVTKVHGPVTAHSDNGRVDIRDIQGGVEAGSGFGAVVLKDVTGEVQAESANGGVEAEGIEAADRARLKSSFGSVRFAGAAQTLSAESDNGSVTLALREIPDDTTASSHFGAVSATLPTGADADIEARTEFGRIDTSGLKPGAAGGMLQPASESTGKSWSGRLGAGGKKLSLRSANGSITIRQE